MQKPEMAQQLKTNQLLWEVLETRKADIIQQWEMGSTPDQREEAWQALQQLKKLAGAIEDVIREHCGSGS